MHIRVRSRPPSAVATTANKVKGRFATASSPPGAGATIGIVSGANFTTETYGEGFGD